MSSTRPFEVTLASKQHIELPIKAIELLIKKNVKRVEVEASFEDKRIQFHAALIKHKSGAWCIYFSASKQKELGVFQNDYFTLKLKEDSSKYGVEMSQELEAVFSSDHEAFSIFEELTPGKQRTIIYAISRYRTSESRIEKSLVLAENLKRGILDSKLWFKVF